MISDFIQQILVLVRGGDWDRQSVWLAAGCCDHMIYWVRLTKQDVVCNPEKEEKAVENTAVHHVQRVRCDDDERYQ